MKNIYNERLLIFADHLANTPYHQLNDLIEEVNIVALEQNVQIPYMMRYRYWVFDELPAVFDDWYYDTVTGAALFEGCDPEQGTVVAVIDYFNLTQDEFGHLFDIDSYQLVARFGGENLTSENTKTGVVYASNIVEFVKRREQ